jgi:hypothetical protein
LRAGEVSCNDQSRWGRLRLIFGRLSALSWRNFRLQQQAWSFNISVNWNAWLKTSSGGTLGWKRYHKGRCRICSPILEKPTAQTKQLRFLLSRGSWHGILWWYCDR